MSSYPASVKKQQTPLRRVTVRNAVTGKTTMMPDPRTGTAKKGADGSDEFSAAAPPQPVCAACAELFAASRELAALYARALTGAKELLLDDTLHHHTGDEAWVRLLRSLGADDRALWARASASDRRRDARLPL